MAKGEENAKRNHGRSDFMTPKKEAKNTSDIEDRNFFLYDVENNEEITSSANRFEAKESIPFSKSYSSLVFPLARKTSDNYSHNNLTFNDELSDKNLMMELNVKGKMLDPSSGNNSSQMFNNNPDSFIMTNRNQRSFNSTNNAVNLANKGMSARFSGDNRSSFDNEINLQAQNFDIGFLNSLLYENNKEVMLTNRRNTLNLDINKKNPKQQRFVSKYEDNKRNNLKNPRPRQNSQAMFFKYNDSTLDSDKLNSNKSFENFGSNKKNSQGLLNSLFNFSAIMKTDSGENIKSKNLLSSITPNQQSEQFINQSSNKIGNYQFDQGLEQNNFGNFLVNSIAMVIL